MNFITQTHEDRIIPVTIQAEMIEHYYPQSTFYIYDGGLDKKSREKLSSISVVEVVDWSTESNFALNSGLFQETMANMEDVINNVYTRHILNKLDYGFYFSELIRWNFFIKQKPLSILNLTKKVEGNIVWIDDDAVLINPIDDIFNFNFDIGVTIRNKYDENRLSESSVNSGVIIFNTNSKKIKEFVCEWVDIIESTRPTFENPNVEQDALNTLINRSNKDIMENYYNSGCINIGSYNVHTQVFPCKIYNHINLICGIDPEKNKIIHFKGDMLHKCVNRELLNDIREHKLEKWSREIKK